MLYFKPSSTPFILMMVLGSLISISSNSWFPIWLGMEMNILGFVPLIIDKKNIFSVEAAIKYFIIQSISSSLLILMTIQNNLMLTAQNLINLALLTKIGAAPFHFWVPTLVEAMNWTNIILILTWQKLAPLIILTLNFNNQLMMNFSLIMSLIFGSLGGLNQTSIKKILAFSSIAHLGWLLAAILMSMNMLLVYFVLYSLSLILTIFISNKSKMNNLNKTFMLEKKSKLMLYLTMLNMGGMPPLLGFFPKLFIIMYLIKTNYFFMCLILMNSAIINLFFYLRLTYTTLNINNLTKKNNLKLKKFSPTLINLIMLSGPLTIIFI